MADDTNSRSYRPADQRWPAKAAPASGGREGDHERSDPLAELARLIGQTDPFGDLTPGTPRAAAPAPAPARPAPAAIAPQPPLRAAAPTSARPSDPYGSPLQFSGKQFDNYSEPQQGFQPAYDPAIYGAPQQQPPGAPSDTYYEDPARVPQGEEGYEDEYGEERPRRGLKLVLAAVALLVLGGSGVLGYRAVFNGVPSGSPPVIKASTTPSKIVPAPGAEASNKQIYDRVGDPAQGERVVSREEKPVEVKDNSKTPSRVVFPGMPPTPSNTQDTAMNTPSPPLNTDPGGPSSAEPKKIKTVPIRPEGTGSASAPRPTAAAPANNTRTAAAQPAPAAAPQAPPAPQANAPLSLSPQAANAEASARPAFPPPPKQAAPAPAAPTRLAAIPPATEVAAGAYTVQISSQRSESEANASFRSLQAKFPSVLGDRSPIIRRADLGDKGIYYRAMVGPFGSQDQATQFCGSLKSAGGQCVVQRN